MQHAKRKKSATAPDQSADADIVAGAPLLPDVEYVEQLLAASAPMVGGSEVADSEAAIDEVAISDMEGVEQPVATEQLSTGPLTLPAQCLLRDAVEYRQHLLQCLSAKTVALDVAAVERIDTAFMQVLLAFVRSRPSDSEPVAWLNVNPVFVEAACLLGVHKALALPEAA